MSARMVAWRRVLTVFAAIATVCALLAAGITPLLAWTERCIPLARYPALFAAYFATWLVVGFARPRWRRRAMFVGSLACAAIFDPGFAALSLVWIWGLHRVLFGHLRHRVAWGYAYAVATYALLIAACNRYLTGDLLTSQPRIAFWGYVFAVSYTFRLAWLLHQVRVQATARIGVDELCTYFLFAPFFVIVPYLMVIPRCDRFCAGLAAHDVAIERSGVRMMFWGIALSLAAWLLPFVYDPRDHARASLAALDLPRAALNGVMWYPAQVALEACAVAAILVGMVRVLGIDLGPPFKRPLLATGVVEWWHRWNTHFRDLLVDLFYYPVALQLRRQPTRAIWFGCASVFLFGSVLFHWFKAYFQHGSVSPPNVGIVAESLVMWLLVGAALVRERRRPPRRAGHVLRSLQRIRTWVVVFVVVQVIGAGVQVRVSAWVAGQQWQGSPLPAERLRNAPGR